MALTHRILAVAGSAALALSMLATSAAAATTRTLPLLGTRMAGHSSGVATVTQVGASAFKVMVTTKALPAFADLHATPARHVYVAWVFPGAARTPGNSRPSLGTLVPILLHGSAGTYTGSGTVPLHQVAGILVTAEITAKVSRPATPIWGVLISRLTR